MPLSLVDNLLGFQATFPPPLKLKPLKRQVQTHNIGVPKIIWRTWKDTSWQTKCNSGVLYTQKTMPKWQQRVFADPQCEQFIFSVFENYPEILEAWEKCNIGVMKADLWRYLILYRYGGLYLDVKCPVLQEIKFPKPATPQTCPRLWTSPWQYKEGVKPYHHHLFPQGEMQQFWIAAEPESPALWNVICQVTANILKVSEEAPNIPSFLRLAQVDSTKSRILACTGPIVYTFALAVSLQQNDKSVVVVPGNCAGAISYMPPNSQEFPQLLDDHYIGAAGHLGVLLTPAAPVALVVWSGALAGGIQNQTTIMTTYLSVAIHDWWSFSPNIAVYQDANDHNSSDFKMLLTNYPDDQTYDELFKINQDKVWVLLYSNSNSNPEIKISANKEFIERKYEEKRITNKWLFEAQVTPKGQTKALECISMK